MSTYYYTDTLTFQHLLDNKETLKDRKVEIEKIDDSDFHCLRDKKTDQGIVIDMNPNEGFDQVIGFSRYGGNGEGCFNILTVIEDMFPNCGLIDEYELLDRHIRNEESNQNTTTNKPI